MGRPATDSLDAEDFGLSKDRSAAGMALANSETIGLHEEHAGCCKCDRARGWLVAKAAPRMSATLPTVLVAVSMVGIQQRDSNGGATGWR